MGRTCDANPCWFLNTKTTSTRHQSVLKPVEIPLWVFHLVLMPAMLIHKPHCLVDRHYYDMTTPSWSPGLAVYPKETPRKPWYMSSPSYRSGILSKAQEAVISDVGPIPQVSYEFFVNSVMPTPAATSSVDLAKINAALLENGAITGGHWSAFPIPAKTDSKEQVVFSGLISINESITEATGLGRGNSFIQKPHESPTSNRLNKTRLDGCRLYDNGSPSEVHCSKVEEPVWGSKLWWGDVVGVEEYKKGNGHNDVWDVSCYAPLSLTWALNIPRIGWNSYGPCIMLWGLIPTIDLCSEHQ